MADQDIAEKYAAGTLIWIKSDEEVWQAAEVQSANNDELVVKKASDNSQVRTLF